MKNLVPVLAVVLLASCSAPKFAAHFPSSNVDSNYHPAKTVAVETGAAVAASQTVTASVASTPVVLPAAEVKEQVREAYNKLSADQKREVRRLIKKEMKAVVKAQKKDATVTATTARGGMDHDLKLAAIFGAVGIVGLIIGSSASAFTIIGGIALLIGVVFFVKWLMRQ